MLLLRSREFSYAIYKLGDVLTEPIREQIVANICILKDVMEQGSGEGYRVELHLSQIECGVKGMVYEWLAGFSKLALVGLVGEQISLADPTNPVGGEIFGCLVEQLLG